MVVGGEEEAWDIGEGFWKKEREKTILRIIEESFILYSS